MYILLLFRVRLNCNWQRYVFGLRNAITTPHPTPHPFCFICQMELDESYSQLSDSWLTGTVRWEHHINYLICCRLIWTDNSGAEWQHYSFLSELSSDHDFRNCQGGFLYFNSPMIGLQSRCKPDFKVERARSIYWLWLFIW